MHTALQPHVSPVANGENLQMKIGARSEIRAMRIAGIALCAGLVAIAAAHSENAQTLLAANRSIQLTGVNIAGAEFGGGNVPGEHGQHYFYPGASTINYYESKGMNIIRLPVLWERLQRRLRAKLDETEMQRVDAVVSYATLKHIKVIIDIHNYAKYQNAIIGTRRLPRNALGDLWRQLAARYKDNSDVIFGLMNEPTKLPTETWLEAANIAIADIRQTGAKNLILVPGNGWSSARDWLSTKYGTPNSQVMLNAIDRGRNSVFEVHQYFDRDFTGTHDDCQSFDIGVQSLAPFTRWARENRKKGFLGEFGAGSNQTCLEALERVLKYMAENNDVWIGWTYWAGGAWWPKDYYTNIEPIDGQDRPQMSVLERFTRFDSLARESPKNR
jgi:endoglucanase